MHAFATHLHKHRSLPPPYTTVNMLPNVVYCTNTSHHTLPLQAIQEVKELKGVTVNMRALTAEEAEALLSRPQYGTKFPALGGGSRPGKKGGKKGGKGGKKGKKSGSSAQEVKPATEEKEAPAAAAPAEPAAAPTPSESTA